MNTHSIKWVFAVIFLISCISLVVILTSNYIADSLLARALPLAIFAGLLAIATAISFRTSA